MVASRTFQFSWLVALAAFPELAPAADLAAGPVSTWTGWHIGVGAGYGMVNHHVDFDVPIIASEAGLSGIGGEGFLGTIEAGYDFQLGDRFVLPVPHNAKAR